jgi:tRNA(Ile)-lysidine synthase
MDLTQRLAASLAALDLSDRSVIVAVSGGPDSLALLDLLDRSRSAHRLRLIVAHADHGIHPRSGDVAATVAALAAGLGYPCEIGQLHLGPDASETSARAARYRWLGEVAERHGAADIVTAHHADDQAETVLMRLLRGSGPAGLAGMAPRAGPIVRPLLSFRRSELAGHLHARGLSAWDDPANADPVHVRSWLRTAVVPLLASRTPDLVANLTRSARLARADRTAWDALLGALPALECRAENAEISVAAAALAGYHSPLAYAILRALGRRIGCVVGERRAERLLQLAQSGISGHWVPLGTGFRAELSFGRLRIYPVAGDLTVPPALGIDAAAGQAAWGDWALRWERSAAPVRQERVGMTAWFAADALADALQVRPAGRGERISAIGGNGARALARFFQEARIPRGRRAGWPVLDWGGRAVWVPGVCRADALVPEPGAEALRVDVTNR